MLKITINKQNLFHDKSNDKHLIYNGKTSQRQVGFEKGKGKGKGKTILNAHCY